jgi:hypothetical protein
MATWPATLPPPALSTLNESPPENRLATGMDKGPPKVRRRSTAGVRPLAFILRCDDAQCADLDDFFVNTTYSGVDTFDYVHPRTGAACTARFTPGTVPTYGEQEGVLWNISINLDIQP